MFSQARLFYVDQKCFAQAYSSYYETSWLFIYIQVNYDERLLRLIVTNEVGIRVCASFPDI